MNSGETFDVAALMADREKFNSFVYTPVEEAIAELKKRREDSSLLQRTAELLGGNLPDPLRDRPRGVLFRQVATPNYELRRFVSIVDAMGLDPLFWEYHADKFVSKNEVKYYLGMLAFAKGRGKKGGLIRDYQKVIDFNASGGKKLSEIKTLWGESLASFHHSLFSNTYRPMPPECFFDASNWLKENGGTALDYYKNYLLLFVAHGVLLENVMLDEKEASFTRDIFLPALIEVRKKTGLKPLIVALEPTDIETDEFWMCHPYESKEFVDKRLEACAQPVVDKGLMGVKA